MVKHQTHIVEDEMTDEAKSIFPPNADVSIWEVMERCALGPEDEAELKRYTESLGLIWISTPFSRAACDFLETLEVPAYKIGSGEADNLPLIRHIASKGKPVILSTGMQTIQTIRASVEILDQAGIDYALLECTNLYPSPPEIVSLQGVTELKKAFPRAVVGFSDHSIGPEMALASVALGACVLERHYTDTRYRKGPDISCSMDPAELRFLIDRSRYRLHEKYAAYDAERRFPDIGQMAALESTLCQSGLVLQGLLKPDQCPAFGRQCTPLTPLGATMVSSEGACAAYYKSGRILV
jgi:N-acetylneuraminate synthase